MDTIPEGYNVEQFVGSTESVIAKQIWNAAIEAAADEAYKMVDKIGYDLYHAIKELKK